MSALSFQPSLRIERIKTACFQIRIYSHFVIIFMSLFILHEISSQHKVLKLIYIDIYLLIAIGLSPGGSSSVHIYTQTINRTTQNKQYIEQHNNLGE